MGQPDVWRGKIVHSVPWRQQLACRSQNSRTFLGLIGSVILCAALLGGCAQRAVPSESAWAKELGAGASSPAVTLTVLDEKAALVEARRLRPGGQHLQSWQALASAIMDSRTVVALQDADQVAVAHGNVAVTYGDLAESLRRLSILLPRLDAEPELLARHFTWLGLGGGAFFSGYYESTVKASLRSKPGYRHPLYKTPEDLRSMDLGRFTPQLLGQRLVYRLEGEQVMPYYTRAEIDGAGALRGRNLELAYVQRPEDAYFLQMQGSGRLLFEDGSERFVHYSADNGHSYTSLGEEMTGRGLLEPGAVSMQEIRRWLAAHPEQRDAVLWRNARYSFFRFDEGGLIGSMGKSLVPWVSLAVDRTTFPLGSALIFSVKLPAPSGTATALPRLGLAQDTGGGIKNHRVDVFCGAGEEAAFVAGHLRAAGEIWLLLPRGPFPPAGTDEAKE